MEMTNKYPVLPTAPTDDEGPDYRLYRINEIQNFLEAEITRRESLSKKYFRAARIVDNIDTVLVVTTTVGGLGGIGLLAMVAALPVVIALESIAGFCSFLSVVGKCVSRNTTTKVEKHEKIKTIASTKLNTISFHVSKALMDKKVSHEEFLLIREELEKYKKMKEEIRSKLKKKITSETEESLIERGRREQRESFQKVVEKHHGKEL